MIIALIIIAIICLFFILVSWMSGGDVGLRLLISVVCFVTIIIAGMLYEHKKPTIDLPDEYPEISHKSNKPDTMITWISNDTVYFRFLVAARQFPKENH